MQKDRGVWVYDIETLAGCFSYTGYNIDTAEIVQFVLHKDKFDLSELITHLQSCEGQVGFNNINFDYPIIHYILNNWALFDPDILIKKIYKEAQRIIEEQNKENFNSIVAIKQSEVLIPQLDLFKVWHYNNKARSTSLKALEISMNFPNVMEMNIDHKRTDITLQEVQELLEYNLNDVLATYEFYLKSLDKIKLRKELKQQYKIPCTNWSDSKIGEQLVLKLYCDYTNEDIWEVKKRRTHRSKIKISDVLFPYISFKTEEFKKVHEFFQSLEITETKNSSDKAILFNNIPFDFGLGGIHACIESGIYISDNQYIIKSCDVASLYPNLAIKNNLFPAHLGPDFCKVYQSIIQKRLEAKKASNAVLADGFKLSANSVYGKSNDINSFLYDPAFTMSITINGQLLLAMLSERLSEIPDSQILMVNTDGLEIKIPRIYENLYKEICKEWENNSNLELEFQDYQKMVIGDINNYLAVTTEGKIKNKGRFEIVKVVGSEMAYHKDNSFKIVPFALQEYFIKGIPVQDTIKSSDNIYDFCGRQKFTKDSYGQIHYLKDNKEVIEKQQKNTRYYISNKGSTFIKYYNKGTTEMINKGYKVDIFNKYHTGPYDINYSFYIRECNKEIQNIEKQQLKLF